MVPTFRATGTLLYKLVHLVRALLGYHILTPTGCEPRDLVHGSAAQCRHYLIARGTGKAVFAWFVCPLFGACALRSALLPYILSLALWGEKQGLHVAELSSSRGGTMEIGASRIQGATSCRRVSSSRCIIHSLIGAGSDTL